MNTTRMVREKPYLVVADGAVCYERETVYLGDHMGAATDLKHLIGSTTEIDGQEWTIAGLTYFTVILRRVVLRFWPSQA